MSSNLDQAAGWGMVVLSAAIFVYYTIWVVILPFMGPHEKIHSFFPPQFYAVAVPLVLMVIALIVIGVTVAVILTRGKLKSKTTTKKE